MRCLRRLVYCVEDKVCPHYFIPENNLFENKIQGYAQETLLTKLYILISYGWQCILLSDQVSDLNAVASDISEESSYLYVKGVHRFLNSRTFLSDILQETFDSILEKVMYKLLYSKSSKIKYLCTFYLSKLFVKSKRFLPLEDQSRNKVTYKKYNTYISTLVINTHHDAVSGWLTLATFFYRRKQYNTALHIIQYSLLKCTPEKLHQFMQFSDMHYELFNLHVFRNMPIVKLWKYLLLDLVLIKNSNLQPDELQIVVEQIIPPIVYAHFLRLLCHYHLQISKECWDSLRDLQLTIEEKYFIATQMFKGLSYNILGISFQLLGDLESAKQALMQSIKLCPDEKYNRAFQTLLLISLCDYDYVP